jgi:hypothetical protein
VKKKLSAALDAWMKAQGDKGQQTEIEARDHQGRNRNRNKAGQIKKKRGGKKGGKKRGNQVP